MEHLGKKNENATFVPWLSPFYSVSKVCQIVIPNYCITPQRVNKLQANHAVFKLNFFAEYVFISWNTFWMHLVVILLEKEFVKDYFFPANFVKCGGQADILSAPRRGTNSTVWSQRAKPKNHHASLSEVSSSDGDSPSSPTASTTTTKKHHPSVCVLSKSRYRISS